MRPETPVVAVDTALAGQVTALLKTLGPRVTDEVIQSQADLIAIACRSKLAGRERRWIVVGATTARRAVEKLRLAAETTSPRLASLRAAVTDLPWPAWLALYDQGLDMAKVMLAVGHKEPDGGRLTSTDLDQISERARLAERKLRASTDPGPNHGRPVDHHATGIALVALFAFELVTGRTATPGNGTSSFEQLLADIFAEAGLSDRSDRYARRAIKKRDERTHD